MPENLSKDYYQHYPDARGHFGPYGGRFVGETLMGAISELEEAYQQYRNDPDFLKEMDKDLADFVGRPSPLYLAENWTKKARRCADLSKTRRLKSHRRAQSE